MARRQLLTDDERRRIFGVPESEAEIIRHYTLSPADLDLAAHRHGSRNRLGVAVQLCLLRHAGFGLRVGEEMPEALLAYLAHQLGVPPAAFRDYGRRAQTRLDHASWHCHGQTACWRSGCAVAVEYDENQLRGLPVPA
jgi:TnpA family transposase